MPQWKVMLWLHVGMYSIDVLIATANEVSLQLIRIDHTVGGGSSGDIAGLMKINYWKSAHSNVHWSVITAKSGHYKAITAYSSGVTAVLDSQHTSVTVIQPLKDSSIAKHVLGQDALYLLCQKQFSEQLNKFKVF